ncbi:hypothetical protein AVEN_106495-1 [Araneus ventricosus]|uniref:Uncharacterized protein n=1 Tax=Araneus ventricosus TaxID=182803 RepID=A0A4Y2GTK4_ARAVE|nr:hypothetical protein AVEN_106495-1 [Araneus ventricosus]
MTNLFVLFGDKVGFSLTKGRVKHRFGENHGSPGLCSNSWIQHYVWTLLLWVLGQVWEIWFKVSFRGQPALQYLSFLDLPQAHRDAVGRRFIRVLTKLIKSLPDRNLLSGTTCFDQSLSRYRKVRSHLLTDIVYWKNALGLSVSWMRFTRSTRRFKYPPADPSMHPRDMTVPRLPSLERRHKGNKTRREDAPSPPSATEA